MNVAEAAQLYNEANAIPMSIQSKSIDDRMVLYVLKEKGPLRTKVPTKPIIRQSSDPTIQGSDQEREIHIR